MAARGQITMNALVATTVAGDLATKWHPIAAVTIVQPVAVSTHLRELTNLRLLLTRCRLFRRSRIRSRALAARDLIEVRPDKNRECLSGTRLNHANHV
jgi:hypothetical protein